MRHEEQAQLIDLEFLVEPGRQHEMDLVLSILVHRQRHPLGAR